MSKIIHLSYLIFFFSINILAQSQLISVSGYVKSSDGKPAQFVHITIKNTSKGTVTNNEGFFLLKLKPGNYILTASIVGYEIQEKAFSVEENQNITLEFILKETSQHLEEVTITGVKAITGMGYLDDVNDNIIYSGKKTEVILLDSLDANTAQNNPRQVLGRIPGANYSETEGGGFPSNGIGFRGLNPSQSIETNTRQNGYNITGDLYGYPESYYLPPLEAVERIEVTRGASSLQFGPQFGGVINYIIKKGNKNKPLEFNTQLTGGSFGLTNSFNSVGGQIGKLNYFGFVQYQSSQGWRPNSDFRKVSGFGRIEYQFNNKFKIGLEYSLLRNSIHMPGGLSDDQFNKDSKASFRTRNWLQSPWNILTFKVEYKFSPSSILTLNNTTNVSARDLVWKNEDGGPSQPDSIVPSTLTYVNREVQRESFKSNTTELRVLTNYNIGRHKNTLATGVRFFAGKMKRQGGGRGTTASDFDLTLLDTTYEYSFDFTTLNIAPFIENTFRFGEKFSVTPGFRFEYINSTVKGYKQFESGDVYSDRSKNRYIFLSGIGLQYKATASTNIYFNISQTYRPTDYSSITPFGTAAVIDPNLKDASGYNADLGYRGSVQDYLNFDISGFYLRYNNRIGDIERIDNKGKAFPYRTNVANSIHKGLESYIEFNPIKAFSNIEKWSLSFFNSLAIIDAKYVSGEFNGKYVEYAPTSINRFGTNLIIGKFSTTFLISSTAKSFGDASNSIAPSDAVIVGLIPAYTVMDWSATIKIKNFNIKTGLNNLTDKRYFTKRTDEYPGPGIIPSVGRSFYFGIGAKF